MNLHIATIFALLLLLPGCVSSDETAQQAALPNIIFIITDDQRFDMMGNMNPMLHTPHMDQLAAEGVRFENAFVTTSICAASRATILTGQFERTHGYTFRRPPLSLEVASQTYPARLKAAGYCTGFVGKLGVGFQK